VVDFVKELHVSQVQADKLAAQEVDGAALLETSVDELCDRYKLSGGAAHAIMRGIAPAVAEVQVAAALAAVEAQSVTLTIFPPTDKKKNNPYKMTLTPDLFQRTFSPQAPLRLLNSSGSFMRIVTSLAEAVEASQKKGMFLHASRSYDDDLVSLNGFVINSATALEIKSTLALAGNERLRAMYGQLELVNEGQVVEMRLSREGEKTLKLAPDGLVVCLPSSVVLFNSAKLTPSEGHITALLDDADVRAHYSSALHAVNLNLPQGKALPPQQPPVVVTVKINADGSVLWNDLVVSDQAALEAQLRQAASEANPPEVQLRPEGAAPYGAVARVLAAAQRLGVAKIGMVGNERFGS
jgi:biopolymer transport protein ExbD